MYIGDAHGGGGNPILYHRTLSQQQIDSFQDTMITEEGTIGAYIPRNNNEEIVEVIADFYGGRRCRWFDQKTFYKWLEQQGINPQERVDFPNKHFDVFINRKMLIHLVDKNKGDPHLNEELLLVGISFSAEA